MLELTFVNDCRCVVDDDAARCRLYLFIRVYLVVVRDPGASRT